MRGNNAFPTPAYERQHRWENYSSELAIEKQQCREEGKDISGFERLFDAIGEMAASAEKARLADGLFEMVYHAPWREGCAYREPSDLMAIRTLRAESAGQVARAPERARLARRIAGAWYGRIAGCLLGKPIEGIRTNELHPFLMESGNWPLKRYILSGDVTGERQEKYKYPFHTSAMVDQLACAPADDDTNYTVLAQALVERYGRDFTPEHVGRQWLAMQPKDAYCTAERVAYVNLVRGFQPPDTAVYENPYREWIGAQIRGDYFGYINPGNPAMAAEMAWRDAVVSHVKNGIYGEMFIAAMLAVAAVEDDMTRIVEKGMAEIPKTSRLYEAMNTVLADYRAGVSKDAAFDKIHAAYDEYSAHGWCHVIPNAMIVAASLLYGRGDYALSVCMAVETGFDTDCNGATVGSIVGMAGGIEAIPAYWTKPINGKLCTTLFGMPCVSVEELVQKTLSHLPANRE